MTNPVPGEPDLATLHKPTGFTSKIQELCATTVERVTIKGLTFEHSGRYGEFAPFEYKIADLKDSLAFYDEPVLQSGLTVDRPKFT